LKQTLFLPALGLFFVALAASTPMAVAQSCSSTTLPNGTACKKPGARCSPTAAGSGTVGNCATAAAPKNTIACECVGAPSPSYNLTLTPLTPGDLSTGTATSTINVIPFNGFTGAVNFTCAVSGMTHPMPTCATPPPATVIGPGSATSQLAVSVSDSTAQGKYTVAVSAVDSHSHPPDNGEQSSSMSVSRVSWTIGKSLLALAMALAVFLAVLTIWGLTSVWRGKRADSQ
jgi:hypothetical protein